MQKLISISKACSSFLSAAVLLASSAAFSSEVDQFTFKHLESEMVDATEFINTKMNLYFDEAIAEANQKGTCNQAILYKSLRKRFRNHIIAGEFNKWVEKDESVPRLEVRVRESIYRRLSTKDSIVLAAMGKLLNKKLGSLLKFGDHVIGTDKFEHFLGSGFRYFKNHYLEGKSIDKVLTSGMNTEFGSMGAKTTGVISYADLSANFNGMRFWNAVLATGVDPLGEEFNHGPYVLCDKNKWIRVMDFDWLNYIDSTFDESVNCSDYRTLKIKLKIEKRLKQIEQQNNIAFVCDQEGIVKKLSISKYNSVKQFLFREHGATKKH